MTTFRALHRTGEPLLLPNAWDYASAAALADAGFAAIGTTSLGVAAANGLADGYGKARAETVALARLLRRLPCPFTVDIEAGFSTDPAEVADLATELAGIGAAGINLEDGRPNGTLADPAVQVELIEAVKAAAPDLFVNARIDTYWLGVDDSTADRADRYVAAGADGIFVPGLADEDRIRELVGAIPVPLNILYLPRRHTTHQLSELGVRRISTGSLLFRTALHVAVGTALAIRDNEPIPLNPPSYAEIQRLAVS